MDRDKEIKDSIRIVEKFLNDESLENWEKIDLIAHEIYLLKKIV